MKRIGSILAVWLTLGVTAQAATLQISPVTISLIPGQNAAELTLHNPGDQPLYGQVRVFRWDQANGNEVLTPTQELLASPPLVRIAAQTDQVVRLVHLGPGAALATASSRQPEDERSYRIIIDELPQTDAGPAANDVTIRLRYSVPVFIEAGGPSTRPMLSWHLTHDGDDWILRVDNAGQRHARISAVQLVSASGQVIEVNRGLLGYALAGRGRQWHVRLGTGAKTKSGDAQLSGLFKIRATVNSMMTETPITPGLANQP